jgi:peptidoglycan hydrolase-like protein with peptidoglycan-binding domain
METANHLNNRQHKKKIILTSIAVGVAGVLGYLGWTYWQNRKQRSSGGSFDIDNLLKASDSTSAANTASAVVPVKSTPVYTPVKAMNSADFPLKKGSKGDKVRLLQQALIAKYGKSILPKYGADGDFRTETITALKTKGLPVSIDASTFNVLTDGIKAASSSLGDDLYKATAAQNFNKVLEALQKMNSTADYTAANDRFKNYRINGVRKTIVNALLSTFNRPEQQSSLKFEFLRTGLQYNGDKWSLSGLGGLPIITVQPAIVWVNQRKRLQVPARVVLGNEISRRLDYTLFENQGKYFLVPTRCVRYL